MHRLVIDPPAFAAQQGMDTPIPMERRLAAIMATDVVGYDLFNILSHKR